MIAFSKRGKKFPPLCRWRMSLCLLRQADSYLLACCYNYMVTTDAQFQDIK